MSGGVRTMVHPDAVSEFAALFRWLRARSAALHLFAYLDLEPRYDPHRHRNLDRRAATRAAVVEAVRGFGVHHTLRVHAERPIRGIAGVRTADLRLGAKYVQQAHKVSEAISMMERHESIRGSFFDVAIRLRPDACPLDALAFLEVALARTHCASLVVLEQMDVFNVSPRWLVVSRAVIGEWQKTVARRQTGNNCGAFGLHFDVHPHHYGGSWGGQVRLRRPGAGCSAWN